MSRNRENSFGDIPPKFGEVHPIPESNPNIEEYISKETPILKQWLDAAVGRDLNDALTIMSEKGVRLVTFSGAELTESEVNGLQFKEIPGHPGFELIMTKEGRAVGVGRSNSHQ